jgi:hypothetical protein
MKENSDIPSRNKLIPDAQLKKVTHTFLSGKVSATVILPIEIARKHGLDRPSNVVVEEVKDGILIRRINV